MSFTKEFSEDDWTEGDNMYLLTISRDEHKQMISRVIIDPTFPNCMSNYDANYNVIVKNAFPFSGRIVIE